MDFSSLWFWGLARELRARLPGRRIQGGRVFAAGVVFTLDGPEDLDLYFSLDPRFPRVECLPSRNRATLPESWQLFLGAQVSAILQPDSDRRLVVTLSAGESILSVEYCAFPRPTLAVTVDGRSAIGAGGTPPKITPPERPFLLDVLDSAPGDDLRAIRGLDRLWLRAASAASGSPWEFVSGAARKILSQPLTGFVVLEDGQPVGVSLVDFSAQLAPLVFEAAGSLSQASSRFVAEARRRVDLRGDREAAMERALEVRSRLTRTIGELEKDRARQEEHERLREDADWLLSQLGSVEKGQTSLVVRGVEGDRRVGLDPRLRPQDQAERWYQEARRLKRGMQTTEARLARLRLELGRLESLLTIVEGRLESVDDQVAAAFSELARRAVKQRPTVKVKQAPVRFRRFRSPGGLAIWVGRNNRENDELTLHAAHREDMWFHAQQCPGSHVVLRSHALADHPSPSDMVAAAATAAYYSRARTSKKVPVIYTLAKYVRKPRKAAAGTVTVEREKSIMVEPGLCPEWDESA